MQLLEGSQAAEAEHSRQQRESAEASHDVATTEAHRQLAAMRESLSIANLAAQIASEAREAELQRAHAATANAKRHVLRRLDHRWERMLLTLA